MNSAELVAVELRKIPGSVVKTYFSTGYNGYGVAWDYQCPCGETSRYDMIMDEYAEVSWVVKAAIGAMRRHVRAEGNEPSF